MKVYSLLAPHPSDHGLETFPHAFSSSGVSSGNSSAASLDRASTGSASSTSGKKKTAFFPAAPPSHLRTSFRPRAVDPDPGFGALLTLGGIGKISGSGSGMNNPDDIYESLETIILG